MLRKTSTVLFYLSSAWCALIGASNQTIRGAADLPWIAQALEGQDLTAFDPILAIWARWIGMFLIVAGVALLLLIPRVHDARANLAAAGVLSAGTIGAQVFSVLALGAYGPVVLAAYAAVAVSMLAPVLGFVDASSDPERTGEGSDRSGA